MTSYRLLRQHDCDNNVVLRYSNLRSGAATTTSTSSLGDDQWPYRLAVERMRCPSGSKCPTSKQSHFDCLRRHSLEERSIPMSVASYCSERRHRGSLSSGDTVKMGLHELKGSRSCRFQTTEEHEVEETKREGSLQCTIATMVGNATGQSV